MLTGRIKTRDRLLDYDVPYLPPYPIGEGTIPIIPGEIISPAPIVIDPATIYPWSNGLLDIFMHKLYLNAVKNGYTGTEEEFFNNFGNYVDGKCIIYGTLTTFPETGSTTMLYFDTDSNILYYWDNAYIPVQANLIEQTVLDGGEA